MRALALVPFLAACSSPDGSFPLATGHDAGRTVATDSAPPAPDATDVAAGWGTGPQCAPPWDKPPIPGPAPLGRLSDCGVHTSDTLCPEPRFGGALDVHAARLETNSCDGANALVYATAAACAAGTSPRIVHASCGAADIDLAQLDPSTVVRCCYRLP